jgi:methylated-DNA-protein-cysteine methyltransferase-like protein
LSYSPFTYQVIAIIKQIPKGKVLSFGEVARRAGNPKAARQVVRILHSLSEKFGLPWHRVINSQGKIGIKDPVSFEIQKSRLEQENVFVSPSGKLDLKKYFWD